MALDLSTTKTTRKNATTGNSSPSIETEVIKKDGKEVHTKDKEQPAKLSESTQNFTKIKSYDNQYDHQAISKIVEIEFTQSRTADFDQAGELIKYDVGATSQDVEGVTAVLILTDSEEQIIPSKFFLSLRDDIQILDDLNYAGYKLVASRMTKNGLVVLCFSNQEDSSFMIKKTKVSIPITQRKFVHGTLARADRTTKGFRVSVRGTTVWIQVDMGTIKENATRQLDVLAKGGNL